MRKASLFKNIVERTISIDDGLLLRKSVSRWNLKEHGDPTRPYSTRLPVPGNERIFMDVRAVL